MGAVAGGYLSFTEVTADHEGYNRWHLYDHLPEQLPLEGVRWGERWVLTPALRRFCEAVPPLDRVHYVTLYLLGGELAETVAAFRALGRRLREAGRFHLERTAHLAGPVVLRSTAAAEQVLVSPEAVPYRPSTGVHVRVGPDRLSDVEELLDVPGVAGVWTFAGDPALRPAALGDLAVTWCWLDGDPTEVAAHVETMALPDEPDAVLAGTFASVDPRGPWTWFDAPSS